MTNTFINIDGNRVQFSVESGIAVGVRRLTETHVSGSQGNVSSTVSRKTEFALICTDGVERPHWFWSHAMYLRDGQRVSLIYASLRTANWAYIVNHDSRETFYFCNPADYVYSLGLVRKIGCLWFLLAVIAATAFALLDPESKEAAGVFAAASIGVLIMLKIVQGTRACSIWKRHLHPEFERIKNELLASTSSIPWPKFGSGQHP